MSMRTGAVLATLVAVLMGGADLLAVADRPMKKDPVKEEMKKLQGTWDVVAYSFDGQPQPNGGAQNMTRTIAGNQWTTMLPNQVNRYTFTIDPTQNPKSMDITFVGGNLNGKVLPCIYEIDGDTMKLCQAQPGAKRPTKLVSDAGSGTILTVAKRQKAK